MMECIKLNDNVRIPAIGFGVFMIPADGSTYRAVREAIEAKYTHFDTAAAYFNEEEVGRAIRDSGKVREEFFVTSKLWLQDYGYEKAKVGIERSLRKLNLDYIDDCVIIGLNRKSLIESRFSRRSPISLTGKAAA